MRALRIKLERSKVKGQRELPLSVAMLVFVLPFTFDLGVPIQWMGRFTCFSWAEDKQLTISGIVAPPYRTGTVIIYKDPRLVAERTDLTGNQTGVVDFSSIVPEDAMGVFLGIEATTDKFFGLNSDDLETAPSPFVKNFLQVGDPNGSQDPDGYVYHERNNFYLPLKKNSKRNLNWEILTGATPRKFRLVCLGYIQ